MNQNSIIGDSVIGSKWFNPDYLFSSGYTYIKQFFIYLGSDHAELISIFNTALFFFSLFFIIIIFYSFIRLLEIRKKEHAHLLHEMKEYKHHQTELQKKEKEREDISRNPRWVKTIGHLFSQHEGDWKLAIMEADNILDDLMTDLGFKGETLGEKLKSANQENFKGLTAAWEAHTVRNRIAHEGVHFELSQHEAKRIVALYEGIFRQYGFI